MMNRPLRQDLAEEKGKEQLRKMLRMRKQKKRTRQQREDKLLPESQRNETGKKHQRKRRKPLQKTIHQQRRVTLF